MKILTLVVVVLLVGCVSTLKGRLIVDKQLHLNAADTKINISPIINQTKTQSNSYIVDINSKGEWELAKDIPKGKYWVEALAPGYHIESIIVDTNLKTNIDIKLRKLPPIKASIFSTGQKNYERGEGGANLAPLKM